MEAAVAVSAPPALAKGLTGVPLLWAELPLPLAPAQPVNVTKRNVRPTIRRTMQRDLVFIAALGFGGPGHHGFTLL